jgi:hypothetical protein
MDLVIGPLPPLHRLLVVLTVLVVAIGSGAWLAHFTALPAAAAAGAAWGGVAGLLLAYVLVHDFHRRPRPVRATRRH